MEETQNGHNLAIYTFLETQLQLFKGHFLITQASMDEEAIHQMRVAIKRIRTIQKLKKHIHFPTIIDSEQYKTIKSIFAHSGNLRDLQIQQNLLSSYSKTLKFGFPELSNHLNTREKELTEKLNQTISETDFSKFLEIPEPEESMEEISDKSNLETESLDFLHKKINNIHKLIFTLDKDVYVHDLRKQVKQLFFILQFLKNQFPESVVNNYDLKTLKVVGEKIGDWNDRDVFKVMLEHFIEEQDENFLMKHAEYRILQYVLDEEKRKYLDEIDVDIYLELMIQKAILEEESAEAAGEMV
jgi:CHAD domain-containing protein